MIALPGVAILSRRKRKENHFTSQSLTNRILLPSGDQSGARFWPRCPGRICGGVSASRPARPQQSSVVGLGLAGLVAMEMALSRPMPVEPARWLPVVRLMAAGLSVRFWLMERSAPKASRNPSYEL